MRLAGAVTFETDESLVQLEDDVLSWCNVSHTSCLLQEWHGLRNLTKILAHLAANQPRVLITSFTGIGPDVITLAEAIVPRSTVIVYTRDAPAAIRFLDSFIMKHRLYRATVVTKPISFLKIARQIKEALDILDARRRPQLG